MILPFYALVVALLMVSRIPYPHIVNQVFRGDRSFAHVVWLLFGAVAVLTVPGYAVPLVCLAFTLTAPVKYVWEAVVMRRPHEDSLF